MLIPREPRFGECFWLIVMVFVAVLFVGFVKLARAQHNHGHGHNDYLGWSSTKVSNCCDNRDCGTLDDTELRETKTGAEIRIADQWCPVEQKHYLIRGRSPDWNKPHACIQKSTSLPPCERLLCFTGKGGV